MTVDLGAMTVGLFDDWACFVRDWDRFLRSANHPATTRHNYLLAATQLARYLAEHRAVLGADDAAQTPLAVTRHHLEDFQAWMIETQSAAAAVNEHKARSARLRCTRAVVPRRRFIGNQERQSAVRSDHIPNRSS